MFELFFFFFIFLYYHKTNIFKVSSLIKRRLSYLSCKTPDDYVLIAKTLDKAETRKNRFEM